VKLFITASRIGSRRAAAEIAGCRADLVAGTVTAFGTGGLPEGVIGWMSASRRPMTAASWRATCGLDGGPERLRHDLLDLRHREHPKGVQRTHYDWMAMCTSTVEGPDLTADDVLLNRSRW